MKPNLIILIVAALVPLVMGFIWYNPKVFGKSWMQASGMDEDKMKGANMGLIFGLTFVLSFLLAFAIQFMVIHQYHMYSILINAPGLNDPTSEVGSMVKNFMEKYGHNFRTFKHGAFHGFIGGFTLLMPAIAINAMFERKGFKYIAVNAGFWIVNLMIMGGIICAWS